MSLELAVCWNRLFHASHGSTGSGLSQNAVAEYSVTTTANRSEIEIVKMIATEDEETVKFK